MTPLESSNINDPMDLEFFSENLVYDAYYISNSGSDSNNGY